MSVYIKGMEMPVDCLACRVACDKESYMVVGRPPKCPLAEAPDGDLISRADAIEAVHNWYDQPYKGIKDCIRGVDKIALDIEALPSAEAVQGEWIGYNADKEDWLRTDGTPIFLVCDKCHGTVINNGSAHWNFCPNCGARMKGGAE